MASGILVSAGAMLEVVEIEGCSVAGAWIVDVDLVVGGTGGKDVSVGEGSVVPTLGIWLREC